MRCDVDGDLGEGFDARTTDDATALLTVVTSANVACGFHAGDPSIIEGNGVVVEAFT